MRLALTSLLLAFALAACSDSAETADAGTSHHSDAAVAADATLGGDDASTAASDASATAEPDASTPAPDAATASPDAGAVTCTTGDCLSNEDCAATEACQSFSDTEELRCCVTGPRGTKPEAASCTTDSECAFGRCLERDDGAKFCSGYCESDLDCTEATMQCSTFFKWCYPRDAGAPPESCSQVSLSQCFYNENCLDAERCENVATVDAPVLCCTVGARGTGAVGSTCTSELDCSFGRCLGGLCSEACDYGVDPCTAGGMVCNEISGMCEPP